MYQVSAQDAMFMYMESANVRTHITAVNIFDPSSAPGGKVRFKDIVKHVESREHCSPIFRRRIMHVPFELDHPYWVDDPFYDIEYHIRHGALPAPGDWRQFCIHIARYHSRPLDMNRPLWEMYVIEGLDEIAGLPKGCFAIATKMHHVAVDGAAAANLLGALSDVDPNGTPALDLSNSSHEIAPHPKLFEVARRGVVNNIRAPLKMGEALLRSRQLFYQALKNAINGTDPASSVPKTRFSGTVSPHKMVDAIFFPLKDLKNIRGLAEGSTINDVILAICSGGLRHYLHHHRELPEESLIAWIPINTRTNSEPMDVTGNNISAMTAPIHTNIDDPVERLKAIAESTSASKKAHSGTVARLMSDMTKHMPAASQVAASRLLLSTGAAQARCNLFISNAPGPQETMYQNGARLVHSMGLAPLGEGMGLFIGTPSYNGEINFTVVSTREMMPDIEFFMDCLNESASQLLTLVQRKPTSKKRKKTAENVN